MEVSAIYVMEVQLNEQDCDDANLVLLSRMKHKTIYVLAYGDVSELAVVEDIVFRTDWTPNTEHRLRLKGLDLDEIWANIVRSIRNLDAEVPLHEAVTEEKRVRTVDSQIADLEKKFQKEKPRKTEAPHGDSAPEEGTRNEARIDRDRACGKPTADPALDNSVRLTQHPERSNCCVTTRIKKNSLETNTKIMFPRYHLGAMTDRLEMRTENITEVNVRRIAEIFPSCVTETRTDDGKTRLAVDFEALKRQLSDTVVPEGKERYVISWPGKSEARRLANSPTTMTLRPCPNESSDFADTRNIYIEGDNLNALKLLRETYLEKVKMIYIDPPYNTGNDFVYNDSFKMSQDEFDMIGGELDDAGNRLVLNSSSNGRFHTDWLNMMYPRLILARDLLKDNGAIYISIDDNELCNLKKICDEVFGESNLITIFPWQSRESVQNDTDLSVNHEYIVAYAKNRRRSGRRLKETNAQTWFQEPSFACLPLSLDSSKYDNPDDDPRGPWKANPFDAPNVRPNLTYPIENPNTHEVFWPPEGRHWSTEKQRYERLLADGRILFGKNGTSRPQLKVFYNEAKIKGSIDNTWLTGEKCGTATQASKDLMALFNGKALFDTPKPITLIQKLITLTSRAEDDDIIMDFFAGSSSTAHAVMAQNKSDGGNRRFVLIQIPEECRDESIPAKYGYKTIAEIGKERIRRAGKELTKQQTLDEGRLDVGFRVFKVDSSNMNDVFYDPSATRKDILDFAADNIKSDRSGEDLLIQVMLELGIELSADIREEKVNDKTVFAVDGDYLIACFDPKVDDGLVTGIAKRQPRYAVFRDSSMESDSVAINFGEIFKTYSPNTQTRVL